MTNNELDNINPFDKLTDCADHNSRLLAKWNTMSVEEVNNIQQFTRDLEDAKWDLAAKYNLNTVHVLKHLP